MGNAKALNSDTSLRNYFVASEFTALDVLGKVLKNSFKLLHYH